MHWIRSPADAGTADACSAGRWLRLAETIYQPQIRGVAVLCDGGGDVRVAARITEMVGALLDLPSNRICVEQRKP